MLREVLLCDEVLREVLPCDEVDVESTEVDCTEAPPEVDGLVLLVMMEVGLLRFIQTTGLRLWKIHAIETMINISGLSVLSF